MTVVERQKMLKATWIQELKARESQIELSQPAPEQLP